MATDEKTLRQRALRAYEAGRLRLATRNAALVMPLIALSLYGCGTQVATILLGGTLVALVAAFTWLGGAWGRALAPGLLAGIVPFAIPVGADLAGIGCSDGNCRPLEIACMVGGLWAGAVIGSSVTKYSHAWRTSLSGAVVVAWLTGALGCVVLGSLEVAGMGLAILIAAAPVAVLRRA